MVIRQGMLLVVVGVLIGLMAAFYLSDLLASVLFDVQPRDAAVFAGVPAILMVVAAVAISIPAVRASRVNVLGALRHD